MNKPRWRWWLWRVAFEVHMTTGWDWARRLWAWCILPAWLASEEELAAIEAGTGEADAPWDD